MKQQTLDGRLLTLKEVSEARYTPPVAVHEYLVEFHIGDGGETHEHVKIEDREMDGMTARDRAIYAAYNQSPYDDIQCKKVTQQKEADTSYTDEWQVSESI